MSTGPTPQCLSCANWRMPSGDSQARTCDVFPSGLPDDIWANRADHRQAYPGDHGKRWQQFRDFKFPASELVGG